VHCSYCCLTSASAVSAWLLAAQVIPCRYEMWHTMAAEADNPQTRQEASLVVLDYLGYKHCGCRISADAHF